MAETSRMAWEAIRPDVGKRQRAIINFMLEHTTPDRPDWTSKELSQAIALPRDSVSNRLNELKKQGLVVVSRIRPCSYTYRNVQAWAPSGVFLA